MASTSKRTVIYGNFCRRCDEPCGHYSYCKKCFSETSKCEVAKTGVPSEKYGCYTRVEKDAPKVEGLALCPRHTREYPLVTRVCEVCGESARGWWDAFDLERVYVCEDEGCKFKANEVFSAYIRQSMGIESPEEIPEEDRATGLFEKDPRLDPHILVSLTKTKKRCQEGWCSDAETYEETSEEITIAYPVISTYLALSRDILGNFHYPEALKLYCPSNDVHIGSIRGCCTDTYKITGARYVDDAGAGASAE